MQKNTEKDVICNKGQIENKQQDGSFKPKHINYPINCQNTSV